MFHAASGGHPGQQLDVLDRLIAPGVAGGSGDIAERAEVGAGSGLAFHGHRESGDGLQDGILIAAILPRPHGAALVTDQSPHSRDRAHYRGKDAGNHLLLGQHHRGVAKAARSVPGAMDAVLAGDLVQLGPEETHVAHA